MDILPKEAELWEKNGTRGRMGGAGCERCGRRGRYQEAGFLPMRTAPGVDWRRLFLRLLTADCAR